ncbi:MAG: DUF2232 domain-containing protein [Erysipelotrichales bacterium]|nr:DUF2232 domain-containing protein [Erysipelotrichales bacterium]
MKKRNPLTLSGLLIALHLIILFIAQFAPGAELVLMLIAPFFSAMYVIKNDKKYTSIFAIGTLIVCSLFNLYETLLYIIPILINGIVYGFLAKKEKDNLRTIYILSFTQILSFFLMNYLISIIFDIDLIYSLTNIFKLIGISGKVYAFPLLIVYCFFQSSIMHYVLKNELKKFSIYFPKFESIDYKIIVASIVTIFCAIIIAPNSAIESFLIVISGIMIFPILLYAFIIKKDYFKIMLVSIAISFLVFTLPIMKFIGETKILIAIYSMFLPIYIYGIYRYFKINYFKKYMK